MTRADARRGATTLAFASNEHSHESASRYRRALAGVQRTTPTRKEHRIGAGGFLVRVTLLHVVTYLVVGIMASIAFDYAALFEWPVIRDYMREFGSVSLFVGPLVQ